MSMMFGTLVASTYVETTIRYLAQMNPAQVSNADINTTAVVALQGVAR
jgi:hypothetical protein